MDRQFHSVSIPNSAEHNQKHEFISLNILVVFLIMDFESKTCSIDDRRHFSSKSFDSNLLYIDCHVTLYGSIFFQCCLDKPGVLDIDVQLKEINQDDSLKHLLEILKNSGELIVGGNARFEVC